MRFNTPEEVRTWCDKVVLEDFRHHEESGSDLNPFSTDGARHQWQRGYDGSPALPWEHATLAYDTIYQRGAAMRRLHDQL